MKVQFMKELEREAWPERFDLNAFTRNYLRNFYRMGRKEGYPRHVSRTVTGAVLMGMTLYHVQLEQELSEFLSTVPEFSEFVVAVNVNEMDELTPDDYERMWEVDAHRSVSPFVDPERPDPPEGYNTWDEYYDRLF